MNVTKLNDQGIKANTVAAIGFFDGVHKAHQTLIETTINKGRSRGLNTAVITFNKHPKHVLFDIDFYYITPLETKLERLKQFDIDDVYVIEFDKEKASMAPRQFIDTYLRNVRMLVCGFDFTFGHMAKGDVSLLKTYASFETIVIGEQSLDGYKIGSTHIRDLIRGGHVNAIPELMGDYYRIKGTIIKGSQKGRTIEYPTANIDCGEHLIPKRGVYATMSRLDGSWHRSMSSVGFNPTLSGHDYISVESFLFDFNDTIYGKTLETVFIERLRNEVKFDSKESLKRQIDQDAKDTQAILDKIAAQFYD